MILTQQNIKQCTIHGALTKASAKALGLTWPLKTRWIDMIAGTEISDENYAKALDGRYISSKQGGTQMSICTDSQPLVTPDGSMLYWKGKWWSAFRD